MESECSGRRWRRGRVDSIRRRQQTSQSSSMRHDGGEVQISLHDRLGEESERLTGVSDRALPKSSTAREGRRDELVYTCGTVLVLVFLHRIASASYDQVDPA